MLRRISIYFKPEIAFGFLVATVLWSGVLGWQAAYSPTEAEKHQCEEAAKKGGYKGEECKTFWARTTSDPVAFFTFWLAISTIGLGVSTILLWRAGERQFRMARATAASQTRDMTDSIRQSTRAAAAMERLGENMAESVKTVRDVSSRQMRAYLSVIINAGIYQERKRNLYFEVRPLVVNSGHTPAHKFTYWASARILPYPIPNDFDFPEGTDDLKSGFVLGPNQNVVLNARVPDYIDDVEVDAIKLGITKRVAVWGIVYYEDVFGIAHETKFAHSLYWLNGPQGEIINGNYASKHNEAT